jgi:hypothetical protein
MKISLLLIFGFLFNHSILADEFTDKAFLGKWCGKWDNVYSLCISISSIKDNSIATYQWVESEGEKFKQSEKELQRINRNTLKLNNIYFVLDENNLNVANAVGIFERQTRLAVLGKVLN